MTPAAQLFLTGGPPDGAAGGGAGLRRPGDAYQESVSRRIAVVRLSPVPAATG